MGSGVLNGVRGDFGVRGPKWGLYGVKGSILGSGSPIWGQGFNFGVGGPKWGLYGFDFGVRDSNMGSRVRYWGQGS